jgi:ABC-2 type transport system ATP-binding protein
VTQDPIVDIRRLTKAYGTFHAVRDLTLAVAPGEIVALLGPNGAGKTTTLRMLTGILQPTSGEARIRGFDCFRERDRVMQHVGYLPDEPAFYDYLRGGEVLRFVAEMHGLGDAGARARADDLIERLELRDALDEFAVNYSKGMKKKLALCCALLHEPELLILDEPTNGLDPFATRTLHAMIRELAERGTAVFYSTHLLDQAERLCQRVGILHESRLAALGRIDELRERLAPGGSLEDVFFQVAATRTNGEATA